MISFRKIVVTALACGALAFGPSAAQAAPAPEKPAEVTAHIAPAAPVSALDVGANATSPYTSPNSTTGHVAPGGAWTCEYGRLCELVWDPTTNSWEIFKMYYCNRYYVYYWNGGGYYLNNQTSSAVGYFYGSSGNKLKTIYRDTTLRYYDWTPVYSIRNC